MAGVLAAAGGAALVGRENWRPEYTFEGQLLYTPLKPIDESAAASTDVATASQLLKSSIDVAKLQEKAGDLGPVESLASKVSADVLKNSKIVVVTLVSEDKVRGPRVLTALLEQFVEKMKDERKRQIDERLEGAQERSAQKQREWNSAKKAFADFQTKHNLWNDVGDEVQIASESLRDIDGRISLLDVQVKSADSKLAAMRGVRAQFAAKVKESHVNALRDQLAIAAEQYTEGTAQAKFLQQIEPEIDALAEEAEMPLGEWKLEYLSIASKIRPHLPRSAYVGSDPLSADGIETSEAELNRRLTEEERLLMEAEPNAILRKSLEADRQAARARVESLRSLRPQFEELRGELDVAQAEFSKADAARESLTQQNRSKIDSEFSIAAGAALTGEGLANSTKMWLAGTFAGLLALLCLPVFAYEYFAGREDPAFEAARKLGLPILARRPQGSWMTMRGADASREADEEYLRLVALRIQQSVTRPGSIMLFSSLQPGDSPTPMVARLARCLSERDERILVIETAKSATSDRALAGLLSESAIDVEAKDSSDGAEEVVARTRLPGLSDYLSFASMDIEDLILPSSVAGVDCVLAGSLPCPREGMATPRMSELLERCREKYTLLLVAGPSASQATDLEVLAARADGILFTSSGARASGYQGDEALRNLVELHAPIVGVIG